MNKTIAFLSAPSAAVVLLFVVLSFSSSAVAVSAEDETQRGIGSQSPAVIHQSSGVPSLTHYAYLPSVDRDPLPITETLKNKYLFVEHWTSAEIGEHCSSAGSTSLPTYTFAPHNGILTLYPSSPELKLQTGDIGYIGSGASGGGYYANYLYRFQDVPFATSGLTLNAIDDVGTVSLEYGSEVITLQPGAEWISSTVSQTSEITTCAITTTHRITNYAFQDRNKIEYYHGLTSYSLHSRDPQSENAR